MFFLKGHLKTEQNPQVLAAQGAAVKPNRKNEIILASHVMFLAWLEERPQQKGRFLLVILGSVFPMNNPYKSI